MGAILSLLIEFTQLFNLRTTDIDDLIMNILRSLIGYVICFFVQLEIYIRITIPLIYYRN